MIKVTAVLNPSKFLVILELHVAFGARNILLEPRLHKDAVHPTLANDGKRESSQTPSGKRQYKRKVPMADFFAKRGISISYFLESAYIGFNKHK